MNTAVRMSLYGLALAVAFGAAWLTGRTVGPVDVPPAAAEENTADEPRDAAEPAAMLPGLAATANGHTLTTDRTTRWAAGVAGVFRFTVLDPASRPVTAFATEHERRLHLVLVRRDGAHYQHVHPELAADGSWTVPLTFPAAGSYRVFADFRPEGGVRSTLGVDVQVGGDYRPDVASGESRAAVVDGYTVTLDGALTAGATSTVTASVSRDGVPVTDLQPYLGAYGHLVALRGSDLAYLHVHPDGGTEAGPRVVFAVEVPTAGGYWLYLDFQHGGVVRTAAFRIEAATGEGGGAPAEPGHADPGHPAEPTGGHGG